MESAPLAKCKSEMLTESVKSVRKVGETMVNSIYGKGKFWAWTGLVREREKEWWMVKMMMKEMMNWYKLYEIRVIGTDDQQVGEVS